ncbi:MAG TPA: TldD/PmbA family protein [Candidatus Dormibacteraeota bacterium]|nr:TldD/PmbA family protein [Candidatus Dormibacteraeota bacterium]
MTERLDNEAVVERALDEAKRRDGVEAEAYLRDSQGTSIEIIDGKVESAEVETERGLGVRVLDERRIGFAYTSDLSPIGIAECVDLAIANARVTSPDEAISFATAPIATDGDLRIFDAGYESHDVAEKTELCLAIEAAARRVDPRITSFYKTSYGDGAGVTVVATTAGAFGTYRSTTFGAGTACVATEGDDKQIGGFGDGGRTFATIDPGRIGDEAARRALEKLRARAFKTQRIDIVLEPYRAMELVGAIAALFSAENVLKGKSLLAGKMDQRVASELVTLRDEGRRVGGRATSPFDGEGTPTQDVVLLREGVLAGYLHSIKTAKRLGATPTGNARRGSYAGTPHAGISNLYIEAGRTPATELVRGADRALALTSLLNLHTIDPISGEFSLGATGTFLERGAPQYPVKAITVAGNLVALLTAIAAVGDDLRFGSSGIGSPTLLVRDVSVGGE